MPIVTEFPAELIAGDTLRVVRAYADYEAPTWDATLYGENKDGIFSAAAVDDGTSHSFTIAAATTAVLKPGRYQIRVRVTDGTISEVAETVFIEVRPDPAAAGKTDIRSWARRTLEAVEAFLEGSATTMQKTMQVGGRSLERWPRTELLNERDKLRAEVRTEERGTRAGKGRNIKVRLRRV